MAYIVAFGTQCLLCGIFLVRIAVDVSHSGHGGAYSRVSILLRYSRRRAPGPFEDRSSFSEQLVQPLPDSPLLQRRSFGLCGHHGTGSRWHAVRISAEVKFWGVRVLCDVSARARWSKFPDESTKVCVVVMVLVKTSDLIITLISLIIWLRDFIWVNLFRVLHSASGQFYPL